MTQTPEHNRSGRTGRWLRRVVAVAVLLAIGLAFAAWGVSAGLGSNLPRTLIVEALEAQTGMRVRIGTVRVSFFGGATLEDVSITPPLDNAPVATVARLDADTRWLPWIVLTQDPGLSRVVVAGLRVNILEDDSGGWNALRAISLLSLAQEGSTTGPVRLPKVEVADATISVSRRTGETVELPARFIATPDGLSTWDFAAHLAGNQAIGRLSPFGWGHRIEIQAANLAAFTPLVPEAGIAPPTFTATWRGDLLRGGLSGSLRIDSLAVEQTHAGGAIDVQVNAEGLILATPRGLWFRDPRLTRRLNDIGVLGDGTVVLNGGAATIDASGARATGLQISARGINAELSASWLHARRHASADIVWAADFGTGTNSEGSASLVAAIPRLGDTSLRAEVRAKGQTPGRLGSMNTTVEASGRTWQELAGTLRSDEFILREADALNLDFSGLRAAFSLSWPSLSLSSLSIDRLGPVAAQGTLDTSTGVWSLVFEGSGIDLGKIGLRDFAGTELHTRFVASGTPRRAELLSWRAQASGVQAMGRAHFDADAPTPLYIAGELNAPWAEVAAALGLASEPGTLDAAFEIAGHVSPVDLDIQAIVSAAGVAPLGAESLEVSGHGKITTENAHFTAETFGFAGGEWAFEAAHDFFTSQSTLSLAGTSIDLGRVGALIVPDMTLEGAADLQATLAMTDIVPETARLDGSWNITDARGWLAASRDRTPDWQIESGRGSVALVGGRLRLHDMLLQRATNDPRRGTLTGEIELDPLDGGKVRADLNLRQWLFERDDVPLVAVLDGRIGFDIEPSTRQAQGPFEGKAALWWEGRRVADVDVSGLAQGRAINAQRITADVLKGTATGAAVTHLDDWTKTRGELVLVGIDLRELGIHADEAQDLRGVLFGKVVAEDGSGPQSFGPLRVRADLEIEGGRHRGLEFSEVKLDGYAGDGRVVLDRSTAVLAGGEVTFWSRLSWHDDAPFVHFSLRGSGLQIEQLARGADPQFPQTPGVMSLDAAMGGYVFPPRRSYGEAEIILENSDLGNMPVISQLYGLLNVGPDKDEQGRPQGRGIARLRLEGDTLRLARLHYYNRGVDVLAAGEVEDIWLGEQSPVTGSAAGALRPLGDSRVPFSALLDRMFLAVSSKAVSLRVEGTVGDVQTRVVPLAEINRTIRRVLGTEDAPR